jgi:crossover junction endodeoxyribonuclease RuvC
MKYAGIDPSLTSTGISIFTDAVNLVEVKRIRPKKLRGPARLAFIRDEVLSFLKKNKVKMVCLEGYAFGSKFAGPQLGELGGVLRLALYEEGIDFFILAPTGLKKYITGKGNASKDIVLKEVCKRWGFDTNSNDEADAYGLGRIVAEAHECPDSMRKTDKEAWAKAYRATEE